jgi:hypothetical protein
MKRVATILLAIASSAFAQVHYQDRAGNLEWRAASFSGSFPTSNGPFSVKLKGSPVYVRSAVQGLDVYGDGTVTIHAAPNPAKKGAYMLQSLTTSGAVRAIQKSAGSTAELTGSSARYSETASEGSLELSGPVKITNRDEAQHRTLLATGQRGSATLDPTPPQPGKSALRTATLEGSVTIDVAQAPQPGESAPSTFHATGAKLFLNNASTPATATLSGDVKMSGTGEGPLNANIEGVQTAVITLNSKGEMTKIDLSSAPGSQTTTRVKGLGRKRGSG